ncbi:hypothetical protein JHK87_043469 [Glycine soja]|nr:hypothetical protein JHK87_043469 [Glycine soja]
MQPCSKINSLIVESRVPTQVESCDVFCYHFTKRYSDLGDQLMQCSHCNSNVCKNYQQNIRTYNMMFSFTSVGIKFDKSINHSRRPPTIRIQGQPCHKISSMLPMSGKKPKFAQLYIFPTENEVQNRINAVCEMLDEYNVHAKSFRMTRNKLKDGQVHNVRLKLIVNRENDGRTYNVPIVLEVVALIVGDLDANSKGDIIVETQHGQLQRIHELHSSYLVLQYPFMFPSGEDGYRPDILHSSTPGSKKRKRNCLTMRKWFAYRLQCRSNESKTLLYSRRLFQQCVVEGLQHSLDDGCTKGLNKGKRVIFPSTFVGSPRYMDQLYFDGMIICSHVGFPNLFITLTCNPNWFQIHRLLNPLNLKATDRPDIISRVFKLKYEQMLMDLTKNQMLGKVIAYEIYRIISAEISSQQDDPKLHSLVKNHMVHRACGISRAESSCMKEGKCSRFYPKMFQPHTVLDEDGYLDYRRRNNGHTIEKNGVIIDNNTSIKYLFKYINKGYDRITAVLIHDDNDPIHYGSTHNDEIKEYLDYTYVPVNLLGEYLDFQYMTENLLLKDYISIFQANSAVDEDHDDIDDVLSKPSISDSKFISWMNTNQNSVEGRSLTYAEFVFKFVYSKKKRCWQLRKKGYTIGRLLWVPPITGELFYLRMMLTICKGPTSFEDLRTIACFAMGFLQDDKEFIEAIKEVKHWGSVHYIRKLFVLLLLTGTMNKFGTKLGIGWLLTLSIIIKNHQQVHLSDNSLKNLVLLEIEQLLQTNQRSLRDYPSMSYPKDANCPTYLDNSLILTELNYNN